MDNMQNSTNTIYKIDKIDNSVCTGMLGANLKCNKYVLNKNKKYDSVVCFMFIVKRSNVHDMDCAREETVPMSGRSGAQSSVVSTRR